MFNGEKLFTSPTVLQCKAGTWFNLEPNSEVIVDNGSTLLLQPGARLDVGADAVLRVKRGGKLVIMGGAELNVANGGRVIIEQGDEVPDDGTLVYQAGAVLRLEGSASEVEIAGQLAIGAGAVFNIVSTAFPTATRGKLRFTNTRTPSANITAGADSRFIVRSDIQYRRILSVEQESLYGPDELVEFSLETATAELADYARLVPPVTNTCVIRFVEARVTSIAAPNGHRGLRLNGQRYVTLSNSRFERGMWGLYAYNTLLGHTPPVVDCRFEHCQTGMQSYGKGLEVTRGVFTNCVEGLNAIQVSDASVLEQCAATANSVGVTITGTAKLRVYDPAFNDNVVGLGVYGVTAFVACGSISRNSSTGIMAGFDAVLHLDGSSIVPHDPVTVVDNGTSIGLSDAERCYLNLGHNDLTPLVTGMGLTVNGTYLCQPYGTQVARYNIWEGTPSTALTAAEYDVATNCTTPVPVVFADPFGATATLCGQANDPCPVPPCPVDPEEPGEPEEDALLACTTCRDVDTDSLGTVPLHVAALAAKLLETDEQAPDNERAALALYTQILANDLSDPTTDEAYIDGLNRDGLRDSYSEALAKGQITTLPSDTATDIHLARMDEVLDARIAQAVTDGLDDVRLAAALFKAQAHRGGGRLDHAVHLMDSILLWVPAEHQEMAERIACLTRLERDVTAGTVHWDAVEAGMATCVPAAPKSMGGAGGGTEEQAAAAVRSTVCSPGIHPVPLVTTAVAEGFPDERTELSVFDVAGRPVWATAIQGMVEVPGDRFGAGVYHYVMAGGHGTYCAGRLVVAR